MEACAGLVALATIALSVRATWFLPILLGALVVAGVARSLVYTGMASLSFVPSIRAHGFGQRTSEHLDAAVQRARDFADRDA